MKKNVFPICILAVFILGISVANAGNSDKNKTTPTAPVKDKQAEKRVADSLEYVNFNVDSKNHTFQNTTNEILLNNISNFQHKSNELNY